MKSLKRAIATAAIFLFAGFSSASASTVVYNGGAPDQLGDIYSTSPDVAAMSFTLTSSTTITGANWWGDCYPATACGSPLFQIQVWTDNSGTPGTVSDYALVGGANQTATGNLITGGEDEYAYSAGFPSFTLAAGTYFFAIGATEGGPWGWETTSSAPSYGPFLEWFNGTEWESLTEQLAFQLTGPAAATPLPATVLLFGTGLGALGFLGWRGKRKAHAVAV
jgi:PEP-CTERM motif